MQRGKTIVFIDNSNIYYGAKDAGWAVDHKKLKAFMEQEGSVWQVFVFASVGDPPPKKIFRTKRRSKRRERAYNVN
jgi:hypothetical protein